MFRLRVWMLWTVAIVIAPLAPASAQFGGGGLEDGFGGGYGYVPPAPQPQLPAVQLAADYVNQPMPQLEERRAVEAILQKRVHCQFVDTPLDVALSRIGAQANVTMFVNNRALEDVGLSTDTPVTFQVRNTRLRTALQLMLREMDLTFRVEPGRIEVTTPEEAESDLRTAYYPCDDLLTIYNGNQPDFDPLIQLVTTTVEPEDWEELGGPGSVQPANGGLVVSQMDHVHYKVRLLLAALRQARALSSDNYDPTPIEMGSQRFFREQTQARLSVIYSDFNVRDTPLEKVVQMLSQRTGVQILINNRSLEDVGLSTDVPVTGDWRETTALTALGDILTELDLAPQYYDELLVITTPEEAERELVRKVYPIRDFFAKESWMPGGDPFEGDSTQRQKASRHYVADYDSVIQLLTTTIEPESWEELGGPGAIQPLAESDALVISTVEEIHAKVEQLLREVRAGRIAPVPSPEETTGLGSYMPLPLPVSDQTVDRTHRVEGVDDGRRLAQIAQDLQQGIAPGSWDGQKRYIVTLGTNQLVVRHNAQVQREISGQLRRIARENGAGQTVRANRYDEPTIAPRTTPHGGGGFFQADGANSADPFAAPPNADPFDGSQDPFGSGDPFGGPDNRFAGPGDDDPFGS
ncbi:hypothetical protein [Blastopirellula retiformator]|uniref:Bacterial type II/III secretion system short domain protein n=1 Tax=Blastopirellula retiformator TaxID=2527970 RepID=A0A5C5UZE2_9BACT|nr:hypothetical protein [Blastopirellula retiformator]TWT30865.1 hypothetical protein Enr8_43910 [Blastopirellula retiformator]